MSEWNDFREGPGINAEEAEFIAKSFGEPAMTPAEQKVREYWKEVCPDHVVLVLRDGNHIIKQFWAEDWEAAAQFTDEHREQVRQIDEEIEDIGRSIQFISSLTEEAIYRRILARLQSQRAELVRGRKE